MFLHYYEKLLQLKLLFSKVFGGYSKGENQTYENLCCRFAYQQVNHLIKRRGFNEWYICDGKSCKTLARFWFMQILPSEVDSCWFVHISMVMKLLSSVVTKFILTTVACAIEHIFVAGKWYNFFNLSLKSKSSLKFF